jgi:orotate phosphoribosyltransferase-like protein
VNVELNENIRVLAKEGINKMQISKQLNCSRTTVTGLFLTSLLSI